MCTPVRISCSGTAVIVVSKHNNSIVAPRGPAYSGDEQSLYGMILALHHSLVVVVYWQPISGYCLLMFKRPIHTGPAIGHCAAL